MQVPEVCSSSPFSCELMHTRGPSISPTVWLNKEVLMQKRLSALKSVLAGVAAIAALAVAPVLAAPRQLVDAGSDYYTARVAGSGFSSQGTFHSPSEAAAVVLIDIVNTFDGSGITPCAAARSRGWTH